MKIGSHTTAPRKAVANTKSSAVEKKATAPEAKKAEPVKVEAAAVEKKDAEPKATAKSSAGARLRQLADPAADFLQRQVAGGLQSAKASLVSDHKTLGLLDDEAVGKDLAAAAKQDPAAGGKKINEALDEARWHNKDDVALATSSNLKTEDMDRMAATPDGRRALEHMRDEMSSGHVGDDEAAQIKRIDGALHRADGMDKTMKDLPASTQEALRGAKSRNGDAQLHQQLDRLAGREDFRSLPPDKQAQVVADVERYAKTERYQKLSSAPNDRGFRAEKQVGLQVVANASIHCAEHPDRPASRAALDQVLNNEIKLSFVAGSKAVGGFVDDDGAVVINTTSFNVMTSNEDAARVITHEATHLNNNDHVRQPGSDGRFVGEYRAYYRENEVVDGKPRGEEMLKNIDKLVTGDGYPELRQRYQNDPDFKGKVDELRARIRDDGYVPKPEEVKDLFD